jgi:hypothetical protein
MEVLEIIQPIQILGWIIIVIIPVIFFVAIKPEKMALSKEVKCIICFVLMGIFALGIISSLLWLLQVRRIPLIVSQFLSLWGFRPTVTAILFPLLRRLPSSSRFYIIDIFSLLDILFPAGMIFFFAIKVKQLKKGDVPLIDGENKFLEKSDSNDTLDLSNKIESKFSGGVFPIFLFCIWAPILLIISLGLAIPFIVCTVIRWICNNSTICGKSYRFKGTAMGLFGRWILWSILTIITIGIYGFWSTRNHVRWVVENIEMIN